MIFSKKKKESKKKKTKIILIVRASDREELKIRLLTIGMGWTMLAIEIQNGI